MTEIKLQPIGTVRSCFPEKFGIPRQPGIATSARATIELTGDFANPDCVRGLEQGSHLWVMFLFSEHLERGWTPLVRPPRSGGKKLGVFATRSTFRPNPIGLSVVKLESIETIKGQAVIHVSGADILDNTPVIDIKPYLPYADSIPEATNTFAPQAEDVALDVSFSAQATEFIATYPQPVYLQNLIQQVLATDPRPTQHRKKAQDHEYGIRLENVNLRWHVENNTVFVASIQYSDNTAP